MTPTLAATPGDLSLVIPKRILDGIIEMIYALDKIAPGTANDDTLLYGVEVNPVYSSDRPDYTAGRSFLRTSEICGYQR